MADWKFGDKHECPVRSGVHRADDDCIVYALEHGDRAYAGSGEIKDSSDLEPGAVTAILAGQPDPVNKPPHYTAYPVEVIELTEHLNFCRGNAVKYIARAGLKGGPEDEITDLKKAAWYVQREIGRLGGAS